MEKLFFNTNFHYVEVVPVANSVSVPVIRIAQDIASKFRAKNYLPEIVFVWIDREGRTEASSYIRQLIISELVGAGANPDTLFVGVVDRMSENWILADDTIYSEFRHNAPISSVEGQNGKALIKKLLLEQGTNYKETKHGVQYLKRTNLFRSALNSNSAAEFVSGWKLPCWWTDMEAAPLLDM